MIRLTFDMGVVNYVLQHPDIWKDVAPVGAEPIDIGYRPDVLHFLVNDGDGVISFHKFRDGLKIHPNILPSKRGKLAYKAVEEAIQRVFESGWPCIYGEIDPKLKHITLFARQMGFKLIESNGRDLFVRRRLDS